jgi:hypothetical protein
MAKKTQDVGDGCMMSICEWGHARLVLEEDINDFEENFLFQSMKLVYLVTTTSSSWLPQLTLMHTTCFLFTYTLLTWIGKRSMPMFIQPRRCNERKEGRIFRSRTSARVIGRIMGQLGLQWHVDTRLQYWLWWLLIFVSMGMETEEQMSVYF